MLKNFYYNLSLKNKITFLFLILIIIPLIITSIMSYTVSRGVIEKRVSFSVLQTFNTVNERMDAIIRDVDEISMYIFQDELILDIIRKENSPARTVEDEELSKLDSTLANVMNIKRYISSIYIYTSKGRYFNSPQATDLDIEDFTESRYFQKVVVNKGGFTWLGMEENRFGKPIILTGRQLNDPIDLEEIGVLAITLYHESFDKIFEDIDLGDNSTLFIIDPAGKVLFHSDKNRVKENIFQHPYVSNIVENLRGSFVDTVEGTDSLVVFNTSKQTGLKLVGVIPISALTFEINRIGLITGIICFVSILVALVAALFVSRGITRPLEKLVNLMERVKGEDFSVKFEAKYKDEISKVANNFNVMIEKIRELIDRIKEEQYKKKSAELRALQAQINPHFLYNTLTSIYWSSRKAGAEDSAKMTSALSNYFKLGLNKGNEITTIQNEIEHARNYLIIQQFRYKDKFDYVFDVEEKILNCKIIKLVLQPLLENSIIHGIEPLEGKALIKVECSRCGNDVRLKVTDNGVGFNISSDIQNDVVNGKSAGYGLSNVVERIKLYFGDEYGIFFNSLPDRGTVAEVKIPFISDRGDVNV